MPHPRHMTLVPLFSPIANISLSIRIVAMATETAAHQGQEIGARRSQVLAVVVVLVLWGLITHGTPAGTGDEPHYQMITYSLAFDHDLDLTNDYTNPDNLALYGRFEAGPHVLPGKDGRLR